MNWRKYVPVVITVVVFMAIFLVGKSIPEDEIRAFISGAGTYGPIVLILLTWATYAVAPLSGSPLLFIGFYAYGPQVVFYTFASMILATITNFWIARIWGRKIVVDVVGQQAIEKVDQLASNYGLRSLFYLRVFAGTVHDVVSYVSGLTNLPFGKYFLVSVLGTIPGTLMWYLVAVKTHSPVTFLTISYVLTYVLGGGFAIWQLVKKRKKVGGPEGN